MKTCFQPLLRVCMLTVAMIAASTASLASGAGLTLANRGHTRYAIVIGPKASATVRHAAHELAADLHQISGADFAVTSSPPSGPTIYVGASAALWAAFPGLPVSSLPAEGFFIQTSGKNLALAGRDDRGTLYAVYTFLEEDLGVRWYSPRDTFIPHHPVVRVPSLRERQVPAFTYRGTEEYVVHHAQWDAHLKLNGMGANVPDKANLGGFNRLFNGGAGLFFDLMPPAKYFAKHPEYYSLINGKRNGSLSSQLSLVNPNVLRIVTAALVAQAKADPNLLVLGLTQNDSGGNNSQGARSRASDARYGAPSGTLLNFVNKVAAAVQQQFPARKIWVETLAYSYTEKPPRPGTIKAGPGVLVCFAPIGLDYGHAITAPQNHATLEHLLGWEKVAPGHLQVWTYVTNFPNYLQPFPDWDELGADMEFYHRHGISGMMCEGDYNSRGGEMEVMRTWVMAHLMWNPKQNVWGLVKEFSAGYYGAAGIYVYRYLRLLQNQVRGPDKRLGVDDSPNAPYLTPAVLKTANQLFEKAESAVKSNAAELNRVKEARLGVRYVELLRMPTATAAERASFRDRFHRVVRTLKRFGVTYIAEGRPVSTWLNKIHGRIFLLFKKPRVVESLDKRWRFHLDPGNVGIKRGWMKPAFHDAGWPLLNAVLPWQNQGYPTYYGVAWYRHQFQPPTHKSGQQIILYLGAVDGNAAVFVNGKKVGVHRLLADGSGWDMPFYFDITKYLISGRPNEIAVRVKKLSYVSGVDGGVQILRVKAIRSGPTP